MHGRSANAQRSRGADEQISHSYSKDSAIDSDFQEWETELINLDIVRHWTFGLHFTLSDSFVEEN